MSILAKILNSGAAPKPPAAPMPTTTAPTAQTPTTTTQIQAPAPTPAPAPAPAPSQPTLDDFSALFTDSTQTQKPTSAPSSEGMYPDFLSPDFQKNFESLDFSSKIPADAYTALLAGNAEPFKQALNGFAKQLLLANFFGMAKLTEEGVNKRFADYDKQLEAKLAKDKISSSLNNNPVLSHPAAKAIREALEAKIMEKYPQATPQEISDFAQQYLVAFSNSLNPALNGKPDNKKQEQEVDWANFL